MHIAHVEIANFRKLQSVRIDFSPKTTLFVGANNSGKTSAMLALRRFLSPNKPRFDHHDLTLSRWSGINEIGQSWLDARDNTAPIALSLEPWIPLLPALDLWLEIGQEELHHVSALIPTLDWSGGLLGVRLRLQPKNVERLYKEFIEATANAEEMKKAAAQKVAPEANPDAAAGSQPKLTLWPTNLMDFLDRKLNDHFKISYFVLDPKRAEPPLADQARPQAIPLAQIPLNDDCLAGLIRVNDIPAQRGFGEMQSNDGTESAPRHGSTRLSDQLRDYYRDHLDPSDRPDPSDIGVLQAIEAAQDEFDARLTESFNNAFKEVQGLGYPGVTDPRPRVSTRLRAIDGLNHQAAVTFEVDVIGTEGETTPLLRLPEANNGVGYQNLIYMIFRLMSFRDAWMRVGKAGKASSDVKIEPLHLVLIEEPEAHLHAQVQQVFTKKAYKVLRAHRDLRKKSTLRSQLVISTHSSHVAHESKFSTLRYFRRLPAGMSAKVPVSSVINLSNAFGDETEHFVERYLRAQHADLFFADAAILVEGPAERMLLPNFIRYHYKFLNQCYITLLEIGGSHAFRLKPLIERLGLTTLIITDLDAKTQQSGTATQPRRKANQVTDNHTLKSWIPQLSTIDTLLDATSEQKIKRHDQLFSVRVAYQNEILSQKPGTNTSVKVIPYTFEDALALENLQFFLELDGHGLARKFKAAISEKNNAVEIGKEMFLSLKSGKKAELALDVIAARNFKNITVPNYISEGLAWLQDQLKKKQVELLIPADAPAST